METISYLADSMGYYQSDVSSNKINISKSIEATVKYGGIPYLVFFQKKLGRKLIILVDYYTESLNWNRVHIELKNGMSQSGVPVIYGTFTKSIMVFKDNDGYSHFLDDYENQRQSLILLIISDGKGINISENKVILESLSSWPMTAWLNPQDQIFWDESSMIPIKYKIPLYPATNQGLINAFSDFFSEKANKKKQGYFSNENFNYNNFLNGKNSKKSQIEELLADALPLAQICSMFPQPITFGMIDALRRKYYPEIPPQFIERLISLPCTIRNIAGIYFSNSVSAILQEQFKLFVNQNERTKIFEFMIEHLNMVKPEIKESPAFFSWEVIKEQINLNINPDKALKRLYELTSIDALKNSINEKINHIPVLNYPKTKQGKYILGMLTSNPEYSSIKYYPVSSVYIVTFIILISGFFTLSGLTIWHYISAKKIPASITWYCPEKVQPEVSLMVKSNEKWLIQKKEKIKDSLIWKLDSKNNYMTFGHKKFN